MRRLSFNLAERGDRRSLSSDKELEAYQRFNLLARFDGFVASGLSQSEAAKRAGFSRSTRFRWQKMLQADGLAGLTPGRRGRPPIAERAGLTPALLNLLQRCCTASNSVPGGFKLFALTPQCPPKLSRLLRNRKTVAQSLRDLLLVNGGGQ